MHMTNLVIVDVPDDGALISIDGLVSNAMVLWIQYETHSL